MEQECPAAIPILNYFCHSFFYKLLAFSSVSFLCWGWHGCLWGEECKREVWIFRNRILLLDHPARNRQNCDFPFHLTAVIVPEFIFSIKVQTDLFVFFFFFSFFCLCALCLILIHECTQVCVYTNLHPSIGKVQFNFPVHNGLSHICALC